MSKPIDPTPDLCDTVAHSPAAARASSLKDARAVRSSGALRVALLALLERKPFDQITVRDICAEAGLHYATFFRHHPTKEALLDAVAAEQIDTLVDLTLPMRKGNDYHFAWLELCAYVDEHRAIWSTLLNGGAAATMREEWLRRAKAVAEGHEPIGSWLPKELGTICSVSLIADTLSWWLAQDVGAYSVEQISKILDRIVTGATLTG
jgi:AcrR family transcriptional regulator